MQRFRGGRRIATEELQQQRMLRGAEHFTAVSMEKILVLLDESLAAVEHVASVVLDHELAFHFLELTHLELRVGSEATEEAK